MQGIKKFDHNKAMPLSVKFEINKQVIIKAYRDSGACVL